MNIKIRSIFVNDKKADGTPFVDKNGNPYKMATLVVDSGKKASMFIGKFQEKYLPELQSWKAGDIVDVVFEKNGEYINFKIPTKTDNLEERVVSLELKVARLEGSLLSIKSTPVIAPESDETPKSVHQPTPTANTPFKSEVAKLME